MCPERYRESESVKGGWNETASREERSGGWLQRNVVLPMDPTVWCSVIGLSKLGSNHVVGVQVQRSPLELNTIGTPVPSMAASGLEKSARGAASEKGCP